MDADNSSKTALSYGLIFAFCSILIFLSASRYISLHSNYFDLGIFETHTSNIIERLEVQRVFFVHSHIASFLYLFPLSLFPQDTIGLVLVILQSAVLASIIWFVYRNFGAYPALAAALYVPLWINNHFDFHYDHLALVFLFLFFILAQRRRLFGSTLAALALMLVKEPFALQTMACGLFLIVMGLRPSRTAPSTSRPQPIIAGILLMVIGWVYFYFSTHYLIRYFTGFSVGMDQDAFTWMGRTLSEKIWFIFSNPIDIAAVILFNPGKLFYLFIVIGTLCFIPLFAPAYLLPASPLLLIAMLSNWANYYDYNTHYTAGLIIPVMFAFIHGLPKAHALWMRWVGWVWRKVFFSRSGESLYSNPLPPVGEGIYVLGEKSKGSVREARLSRAFYVLLALWIFVGHVMLSPSPISRLFWSDKVWSYSWRAYVPTGREAMMKAAMVAHIPADRDVSVSTQNTVNWGHLAHRKVYLPFPVGVGEPHKELDWSNRSLEGLWTFIRSGYKPPAITHERFADYVVLDMKRPYFLVDKGCGWIYGECRDKTMDKEFLAWVAYTRSHYETVFEQDGFMILRRWVK